METFSALRYRPFALLWFGQTVSRLGDSFYLVALSWWVLEETGSASAMGTVLICAAVPQLAFSLFGGVIVDRVSRIRLMLASDLLRAGIVGGIAALAWTDHLTLRHLFVASGAFGFVSGVFHPAYTAVVPDVLPADELPSANALRFLSRHLAKIGGPLVAGVIVASGGTALAFTLDAVSFAAAGVGLVVVARLPVLHRPAAMSAGALADLRAGFATVAGSPWLWVTILIAGISNLTLAGPVAVVLPLLVRDELDAGVRVFAVLNALSATGAVIAAIWLGRRRRIRRRGALTYVAWLAAALITLVMGLPITVVGAGIAMFLLGAASTTVDLVWGNSMQDEAIVPRDRLGRVASIDSLGSYALVPIGFALSGVAADRLGPARVFVLGGAMGGLLIGVGLLHPGVRGLD